MKNHKKRFLSVGALPIAMALACSVAPQQARATLARELSATRLTRESNLIVRGRVESVDKPQNPSAQVLAHIKVDAVLKGAWDKGTVDVWVAGGTTTSPEQFLFPGQYSLFFLFPRGEKFVPSDRQHIDIPVREGRRATNDEPSEPLERVREELLFSAASQITAAEKAQAQEMIDKLKIQLPERSGPVRILRSAPSPVAGAASRLGDLPSEPRTLALFQTLSSSQEYEVKLAALTARLRLGQIEAIPAAVAFIESEPKPAVQWGWDWHDGLRGMANSLRGFSSPEPEALAALGAVLKSPSVEMRRAAAYALGDLYHGPVRRDSALKKLTDARSIPYLGQALDDEDASVRSTAMSALADITSNTLRRPKYTIALRNNIADPAPPEDKELLAYWKNWWKAMGQPLFEAEALARP